MSWPGKTFNINSPQQLGQDSVRGNEFARAGEVRQGQDDFDRGGRAGDRWRRSTPSRARCSNYRQLGEAEGHLCGRAAGADRSEDRPRCTPPSIRPARRRDGCRPPIRICKTFRSAPSWAARFARRSYRGAGWKLMVADYSQIELRLLAHMSRDPVLMDAFRNGEDIHTRTAAEVFGVPPLMVTPEHAPQRQGGQLRDRLRTDSVRTGGNRSASSARKPSSTSAPTSSATPACASSSSRPSRRCAASGFAPACSGAAADSGYAQPQSQRAQLRRAHRGQYAAAGDGRGLDQAGHDPHRPRSCAG